MAEATAVLIGATGLVGQFCLQDLLRSSRYTLVIVLSRRPLEITHPKLSVIVQDFRQLDSASFPPGADLYCALGTTIKKAGSPAAFREVDLDYPLAFAQAGRRSGARQFALVSSVGASAATSNLYLGTKGELEAKLADLGFSSLHLFRPSLLVGPREEKRLGERAANVVGKLVQPLLIGPMRKYRPILAETVAAAMVAACEGGKPGRHIYHYDDITSLATRA